VKLQHALPLFAAGLLSSCPSEPTSSANDPLSPGETVTSSSVLDEVEVMGADEAHEQAEQEITEENVLDALGDLEKEIGSNP
jgi:hypothetical protein